MRNLVCISLLFLSFQSAIAQISLSKLVIESGDSYLLIEDEVLIDTLVMHDNSQLLFDGELGPTLSIKVKYAEFGINTKINGNGQSGGEGIAGPDGAGGGGTGASGGNGENSIRNGEDGSSGRNLNIYIKRIKNMKKLTIEARGGNGGRGGRGGKGGNGTRGDGQSGRRGGNGGQGGNGSDGGNGANGGRVQFKCKKLIFGELNLVINVSGGVPGNAGPGGAGGIAGGGDNDPPFGSVPGEMCIRDSCGTAYSFQGEERDTVLISFCLDNNSHSSGFIHFNKPDVFNVTITRAKSKVRLFTSFNISKLAANSYLRLYIEMIDHELHTESIADKPHDEFLIEVRRELDNKGYRTKVCHEVADLSLDMVVFNDKDQLIAIDLIGYPGHFEEGLALTAYKVLHRTNIPTFPLPYSFWKFEKERCLAALEQFIESNTEVPDMY